MRNWLPAALILLVALASCSEHRDFQPDATVCPEALLAPLLPPLAAELALIYGTGGYTGP